MLADHRRQFGAKLLVLQVWRVHDPFSFAKLVRTTSRQQGGPLRDTPGQRAMIKDGRRY
jgi:hypothetical protein